jgi:hypothetical protein
MVKALARAFRWRKLLETGAYGCIDELAISEKINSSYVSRILRLTLLAPYIVDRILDRRHPPKVALSTIMRPFPLRWDEQIGSSLVGAPGPNAHRRSGGRRAGTRSTAP